KPLKRKKNASRQKWADIRFNVVRQRLVVFVIDPLHPNARKSVRLDAMALEYKYARRCRDDCDLRRVRQRERCRTVYVQADPAINIKGAFDSDAGTSLDVAAVRRLRCAGEVIAKVQQRHFRFWRYLQAVVQKSKTPTRSNSPPVQLVVGAHAFTAPEGNAMTDERLRQSIRA